MARNNLFKCVLALTCLSNIVCKNIDLAFLIDSWPKSNDQAAIKSLIELTYGDITTKNDTTHVGFISSGSNARIQLDFDTFVDSKSLDDVLDNVNFPQEPSNIGKALDLANYGLFRNSGRSNAVKFLVVIARNKSADDVSRPAQDLQNSGVNVLTVHIGRNFYNDESQNIASPPKGYNTLTGDFQSLETLSEILVTRMRHIIAGRDVTSWNNSVIKPTIECSKRCETEVKGETVPINCQNCKLAGCCHVCCNDGDERNPAYYSGPVQLVFLLDQSGELTNLDNFETLRGFLKNLTRHFDMSDKKSRLGIVSISRDNVQVNDLRRYHERGELDSRIDRFNYEGSQAQAANLNKGLDAVEVNLFSDTSDLNVPKVLVVFDSGTLKDVETEVKAFKLQSSDVQTFCVGLGSNYPKDECEKIVEKPAEKYSLFARVPQLSKLKETISLMIINGISEKYCPSCGHGRSDACRPCTTARHYMGNDKGLQNIRPSNILKILRPFDKDKKKLKTGPTPQHNDENDDDDDDDNEEDDDDVQLNSGGLTGVILPQQIGAPLPSTDLTKGMLQNAIAPDLIQTPPQQLAGADKQPGLLQQNLLAPQQLGTLGSPQSQSMSLNQPVLNPAFIMNNQNTPSSVTGILGSDQLRPSESRFALGPENANAVIGGTAMTNQPTVVDHSLLNQAIFGANKKFQRRGKSETHRKHTNPTTPQEDSPASTDDMTSFQAGPLNPGVTSSMPMLPPPLRHQTDVQDSIPTQFQSLLPPEIRRPLMNNKPSDVSQQDKISQLDEYKYDRLDQGLYGIGCNDISGDCGNYVTEGVCSDYSPLTPVGDMTVMCRKTCGLCDTNAFGAKKKSHTSKIQQHRRSQ